MEEGGRGVLEGSWAPRHLCLGSGNRGVSAEIRRGPAAHVRGVCCGGAALRWLREPPPALGLRAPFFHGVVDGARGSSEGSPVPADAPVVMLAFAASGV